jgi:hypothetical protein
MFDYSDPVGRDFLGNDAAKTEYRRVLQGAYDSFARRTNSAFTWLEALAQLSGGQAAGSRTVDWRAFPLTSGTTDKNIDGNRLRFQDEYVEWLAETAAGKLVKVTFTTEFPEYFEAFAAVELPALTAAIQDVMPGAVPTAAELFGPGFNAAAETPQARSQTFFSRLAQNPWNNGQKGILCLTQRANTLGALFNLLTECGVPRVGGAPENTCSLVGGACGVGRSSDPAVCTLAQQAARGQIGFSLADPAGIHIIEIEGVWSLNGTPLDINDPARNQGIWAVSRNGRRGVLSIPAGLNLDGQPLITGAQVAHKLQVGADLVTAPDAALPAWAKIGQEIGSRGPG